ncbi:hypothetical protein [Phaeovulum vinaykumarii]|uniref:Uncharacterized protein n=1 Tax=Phaeovulum vinaykumarii TaxID=407234 RepID=A0A1N7JV60_9RHOB|nr:hypothetical protein [Phaeovulum vinaykumarii]SIS53228.1 hypothetical protein SAMN05421795_101363 [Phaeovulum vinaykumarii]SOB91522.1 hypothetical protein SAMN05878426_101361 [Phaeovulum vinaykumarii]
MDDTPDLSIPDTRARELRSLFGADRRRLWQHSDTADLTPSQIATNAAPGCARDARGVRTGWQSASRCVSTPMEQAQLAAILPALRRIRES